ncbi:hypothetical protein N658DRAFT_488952 [Parathielavia hyrcaniae]|uniref:DUF3295 domain-containing protein n=1 Tax=Parathielavia hyrcaniae TaxID=113614 RepID=A0AAN6SYS6_9PEZI|nr:hypothetical protein N658DRAFT_488952 [Parathielavia hyrcaniae]
MSQLGGLSGEGFQRPTSTGRKGRTLLKNKLVPSANPTSAISNSEDGIERAIDESAIDDDAEQWEDDPARDNADESKLQFKRRDLPANRPSCSPSLLTLIMEQSTPALSRPGEGLDRPSSVVSPEDPTDRRRRKTNHAPPMRPINKRFCTITDDARTRLNIIDAELTRELMENLLRLRAFPKHVIKEGKDQDDSIWDQYSDPKSW